MSAADRRDPPGRREDARFLTGRGRYVDDIVLPGMVYAVVVRSPYAHADIGSVEVARAKAAPGVRAVLSGADYAAAGLGDIPCVTIPDSVMNGQWPRTPFPALVADRVRAIGDPVALVVAESLNLAKDAAELVDVAYDERPAVATIEDALEAGAPRVWDHAPGNIGLEAELGDAAATAAAFARAAHVVELRVRNNRLVSCALEPRGCLGAYDAGAGRYSLTSSTQNPHAVRTLLADSIFGQPAQDFQVVAGDVGGGFGPKGRLGPEDILVLWAAKVVGRPVKWTADRSESFLADFHSRDQICEGRIALDEGGRLLALEATSVHNLGCRLAPASGVTPFMCAGLMTGPYDIPAAHVTVRGVLTNSRTTAPYRGAGGPEAACFIEGILNKAAEEIGLDPLDLRMRNFVPSGRMPYETALGTIYDSGDFAGLARRAMEQADWQGFEGRRRGSAEAGRLRGRGLSVYVEACGFGEDRMEIRFDASGEATIVAGTFSHGQGHETIFTNMAADWLGLEPDRIRFVQGDTDKVVFGGGTYASRSMVAGGSALRSAADGILARAKDMAAHILDAEADEVVFEDGRFTRARTNRWVSLPEVAMASYAEGWPAELGAGLEAVGNFAFEARNYPSGCHVVEVEVDPESGAVEVVRYAALDDVGRTADETLLDGQAHGGIVQGLGQALLESVVHDSSGQLLTGSFVDYALPRAGDLPPIATATRNVPSPTNPLGMKGGGELGTVGAPPAILAAIADALRPLGVEQIDMPATPHRVWLAIRDATAQGQAPSPRAE